MSTEVISLDIFDTLVLRKEAPLDTLRRLPSEIQEARIQLHLEHYPTKIEDFYGSTAFDLKDELDIELSALTVNPQIINFVKGNPGTTFILVSDMYLPESGIRYLLNQLDVEHYFEKIYVSCEHGASKEGYGKLFDIVKNDYGENIVHIGDNYNSDFLYASKKIGSPVHYVSKANSEELNYDLPSIEYFHQYIQLVLAPVLKLTEYKLKKIVSENDISNIVCLGSVHRFYKDQLGKTFPQFDLPKLEISRFNIMLLLYKFMPRKEYVMQNHLTAFLQYYYPEDCEGLGWDKDVNPIEQIKICNAILDKYDADLQKKSSEIYVEFCEQCKVLDLTGGKNIFLDFGYQGSFAALIQYLPILKNKDNIYFLSIKESNNRVRCTAGIEIPNLPVPTKILKRQFWILDSEIIIKTNVATPLAFKENKLSTRGCPELYHELLETIESMPEIDNPHALQKEVEFRIINHIMNMDYRYYQHFNWLSERVSYQKYSMREDGKGFIKRHETHFYIDSGAITKDELVRYGESIIDKNRYQIIKMDGANMPRYMTPFLLYKKGQQFISDNL